MALTLDTFVFDILCEVVSKLDPVSLVSVSLVCHLFKKISANIKDKQKISNAEVLGMGILNLCVKYDLEMLFDHWKKFVSFSLDWTPKQMMKYAGALPSQERTIFWIGKIYQFIYSYNVFGKQQEQWDSFSSGVIKTNSVVKYTKMAHFCTSNKELEELELEEGQLDFGYALKVHSFKIAKYLARKLNGSWGDMAPTFHSPYAINALPVDDVVALRWFLKHVTVKSTEIRVSLLNRFLQHFVASEKCISIILRYQLFEDVLSKVRAVSIPTPRVALEIIEFCPHLLRGMSYYLWDSTHQLDPRAEQYLKKMTSDDIYAGIRLRRPTLETFKRLCQLFPPSESQCIGIFGDLCASHADAGIKMPFVATIKSLIDDFAMSKLKLYELLAANYLHRLAELFGEGIFSDEDIINTLKDSAKNDEPQIRRKAGVPRKR